MWRRIPRGKKNRRNQNKWLKERRQTCSQSSEDNSCIRATKVRNFHARKKNLLRPRLQSHHDPGSSDSQVQVTRNRISWKRLISEKAKTMTKIYPNAATLEIPFSRVASTFSRESAKIPRRKIAIQRSEDHRLEYQTLVNLTEKLRKLFKWDMSLISRTRSLTQASFWCCDHRSTTWMIHPSTTLDRDLREIW